jgi:drug/metabolite transporter (DMT)-like permease
LLAAYFAYTCGDATAKALGATLSVFEIGLFGTLFSILPGLFVKPASETWRGAFRPNNPRLMLAICVLRTASSLLATYSFVTIPLAEAYALVFLVPVFITLMSVVFLHEKVTLERWALVLISFAGVLLVVRPGFRDLELGHPTALGCAVAAALTTTAMRFISGSEKRTSLFLLPSLATLVVNGVMVAGTTGLETPGLAELGLLIVGGILGGAGYLLQIAAVTYAPASRVAPMQYSQVVWALILGVLFFAELPDVLGLVGLAVVVVAGIATVLSDGARARIAGRWAQYRARKLTTPDDASRISGPPET